MINSKIFEPAFENHGDFGQLYVYSFNYQECKVVQEKSMRLYYIFLKPLWSAEPQDTVQVSRR